MHLGDPGMMGDYELLSHVHNVHGNVPGLVKSPEHMTKGVMLDVRAWHDELHQVPTNHTHDYFMFGDDTVAEGWKGVHYRDKAEGLGKPAGHWIVECDKHPQCFYAVSAPSEEAAWDRYNNHRCPHDGVTHYGASVTVTLIEECWQIADGLYLKLQKLNDEEEKDTGPEKDRLRYELRGISRTLLVFVKPYFPDVKAIATEITKRHAMAEAGTPYETPGTQTRIFETPKALMPAEERADKVLTQKEKDAIIFAKSSGMFTDEQIAATYNISLGVVKAVKA